MEKYFKYSILVKIISAVVVCSMFILIYFTIIERHKFDILSLIGLIVVILLIIPIIFAPISIKITTDGVFLKLFLFRKFYSKDLYEIDYIENVDFSNSVRLFGSGGFMGYTGWFWKKNFGVFKLIQTSYSNKYIKIRKKTNQNVYI